MTDVDYEQVAQTIADTVPLVRTMGLEFGEVRPGYGEVFLSGERTDLHNHLGGPHAGALFTLAETASGAAVLSMFLDFMGEGGLVVPERVEVHFGRLARGDVKATAQVRESEEELMATVERDDRVRFPVRVELTNRDEEIVSELIFHWYVRKNS